MSRDILAGMYAGPLGWWFGVGPINPTYKKLLIMETAKFGIRV